MQTVQTPTPGGPEALTFCEVPQPTPAPDQVLIQVAATAVNRADLLQRQGHYPPPAGAGPVLGLECAGVVAEVGSDVTTWQVGDRVCALLTAGGYAEYVAVPAGQVMPVPDGLTLTQAAALPEVACTAWSNLFDVGQLQADQWVLIHGGSGGVGSMATQLASAAGAHVAVTARTPDKLSACKSWGASVLIDYSRDDFVAEVRAATDSAGVDLILDNMGAKYLSNNLKALRVDGTLVIIGLQGGIKTEINLAAVVSRRLTVAGTTLRAQPVAAKSRICAGVVEHVWPLINDGRVHPVVDCVMPLRDVTAAHQQMSESNHIGKIVLQIEPDLAEDA